MSEKPQVEIVKLSDLQPDPNNANQGTERGYYMLTDSLRERGAGRSALATREGVILAGNKTHQAAADEGIDEAILVHSDGKRLVVVVRDDLEHGSEEAKRMALEDNRVGQVSLEFDPAILASLVEETPEITDGLVREDELQEILGELAKELEPIDYDTIWQGMPEFEQEDAFRSVATLKVHFASEEAVTQFSNLIGQTVTVKSKYIWYPKQKRMNLKNFQVIDE